MHGGRGLCLMLGYAKLGTLPGLQVSRDSECGRQARGGDQGRGGVFGRYDPKDDFGKPEREIQCEGPLCNDRV